MICRRTLRLALGSPNQDTRIICGLSYNLYLNRAIPSGVMVIKPQNAHGHRLRVDYGGNEHELIAKWIIKLERIGFSFVL